MPIWFTTIHQWTNSSNRKLFFVSWFNFCFPPKPCYEVRCHSSLHPNCHHQLVFAKFDLKIFYPPPYKREIRHYNNACTDIICRSAHKFSWENSFSNTDANQKVYLFNEQKRILFLTLNHKRKSFVITVISHESVANLKIWLWKKTLLRSAISKTTALFNYFEPSESLNCHNWKIKTTVLFSNLE